MTREPSWRFAAAWGVATVAGAVVGMCLGWACLILAFGAGMTGATLAVLLALAGAGYTVPGLCIGFAQALVLGRRLTRSRRWVVATWLGLGLVSPAFFAAHRLAED